MLIKLWKPSPFKHERPQKYPLDMIVIHHIGSKDGKLYSVSGAVSWFTNEELHRNKKTGKIENKVSAHYIIPRDLYENARVVSLVGTRDVAYHAGVSNWTVGGIVRKNINNYSIGIELEGDGNLVPYTDSQYECLAELVRDLMNEYGIPKENIVGHEDIAPKRKVDPGRHFDWKRFRNDIVPPGVIDPDPETVTEIPDTDFHMESGETRRPGFFGLLQSIIRSILKH